MAAGTRSTDPERARGRRMLLELAAGLACSLAVTAGLQLLAGAMPNPLARASLGALGVSLVASAVRMPSEPWGRGPRRRASVGVGFGLAFALSSLAMALATGYSLRRGELGLGLALGLGEALAGAYRDELWLRGLPAYFGRRAGVPRAVALAYLIASGAAASLGSPHPTVVGVVLATVTGALPAVLWIRTEDPWAPVAATASWRLVADVLLAGDGLELAPHKLPSAPSASGSLAWVMAGLAALAAVVAFRRAGSTASAPRDGAGDAGDPRS